MSDNSKLSVGKYSIELSNGPTKIFYLDEENNKQWLCTTTDPERAMSIVEGLILVETKRFYYPNSTPTLTPGETNKPIPPFMGKRM